jgi:Sodium:neurotransmitter symporter family
MRCNHQFLLVFNWADYKPSQYGSYVYPTWADVIGWFMSFFVVMWIPIYAIYRLCQEHDGGLLTVRNSWSIAVCMVRRQVYEMDFFKF